VLGLSAMLPHVKINGGQTDRVQRRIKKIYPFDSFESRMISPESRMIPDDISSRGIHGHVWQRT
jgi:hypothetical protein